MRQAGDCDQDQQGEMFHSVAPAKKCKHESGDRLRRTVVHLHSSITQLAYGRIKSFSTVREKNGLRLREELETSAEQQDLVVS